MNKHGYICLEIIDVPYKSRTSRGINQFLSFLQYQSNQVTAVCTSMDKLQRGNANSQFGILLMVSICQNVTNYGLEESWRPQRN